MDTLKDWLEKGCALLSDCKIDNAKGEAWYLLEYVRKIDRVYYLTHMEEELTTEQKEEYMHCLKLRMDHIPLQYITGTQEFMGLEFKVNSNVLIPRQDTETLIEEILSQQRVFSNVLDMCTGSGCIGISLAKLLPCDHITGVDISDKALEVAKENAHTLNAPVEFIKSNLFEQVSGTYDLIVSNPPYIPTLVVNTLMPEVKEHEPILALDGMSDGLYFYKKIVEESVNYMNEFGFLFFEIGYDQGKAVADLMRYAGYSQINIKKDLAGLDRIVYGRYNRE